MTPKEKANELVRKMCFNDCTIKNIDKAKQCALITVEEILSQDVFDYTSDWSNTIDYWQEVKQEIEKL